jgi:hypothetical protein
VRKKVTICHSLVHTTTCRRSGIQLSAEFWLPVSAEVRGHAGVAGGDEVEVGIELDTEPREVTLPSDLAEALQRDGAQERFAALSCCNQRRIVL